MYCLFLIYLANQFRVEATLQAQVGVECAFNASAGGSNWIFRRQDTNGVLNSLPACDMKCTAPPVAKAGLQLAWNGDVSAAPILSSKDPRNIFLRIILHMGT